MTRPLHVAGSRPACDPTTLADCEVCGKPMHRARGPVCAERHSRHQGRGACARCRAAVYRADGHPDELGEPLRTSAAEEVRHLVSFGESPEDVAARVGVTVRYVRRVVAEVRAEAAA